MQFSCYRSETPDRVALAAIMKFYPQRRKTSAYGKIMLIEHIPDRLMGRYLVSDLQ